LRKLIAGILMLVCSLSTAASALSAPLPAGTVRYRQDVLNSNLQNTRRWEERRRKVEERRRMEEERRRLEEERRRQEEERRRMEEERRRKEEQRRQEEERRRKEERWRQEEERRRQEERRRPPVARPPHYRTRPEVEIRRRDPRERLKAKKVLRDTGNYLIRAQREARRGRYYFGLGKAYAHQEEAKKLYWGRHYRSAMAHSLRARQIARDVIEANRPGRSRRYGPPPKYNDEIDNELSIKIRDDKAVLSLKINL
jgi:hypothetical protein